MGTGMENIKVLLAAPKSTNLLSNEPKKLVETKLLKILVNFKGEILSLKKGKNLIKFFLI